MIQVACIIPAYRQPGLLAEAIESAMEQRLPGVAAVVVDDGCPFEETRTIVREAQARHPGRVHLLRRPNGGLSAARNSGIEYALAAFPALEAVYFLDADNRIRPDFLTRALAALRSGPDIGWAYPDIDDLGPAERWDTGGPFLQLAMMHDLYCEAGSLVARRMLEAGLRFDEGLRQGFEDAEFWLRALRLGFRGAHIPTAGFRYRRRAESMLADSERVRPQLLFALRERNAALWTPRALLAAEARELPRHAILPLGAGQAWLSLDPDSPTAVLSRAELRSRLAAARSNPARQAVPPLLIFADSAALQAIRAAGLQHWLCWQLAIELRQAPAIAVALRAQEGRIAVSKESGGAERAPLLALATASLLNDPAEVAIRLAQGHLPRLDLNLPGAPEQGAAALGEALAEIALLPDPAPAPAWRREWRTPLHRVAAAAAAAVGLGVLRPSLPRGRQIAIVQPLHAAGGVEKALLMQARVLRRHGWTPHLVIAERRELLLLPGLFDAYASISFFPGTGHERLLAPERAYFGAEVSAYGHHPAARDALGLLAGMDVVLNTHSLACHALVGRLRRLGPRCLLGLHLVERDAWGRPHGQAHSALAYEHAYDAALVISERLRDWCLAQGWPAEKLLLLRNAPGHEAQRPPPPRERATRTLRALYLGRLDRQKGLDRLAGIIAGTHGFVDWRVVGAPVLDGPPPDLGVTVEPPTTDARALDELYAWADVLLLPSRFEGVPLSVLEAQRMGCVPVVTDVGAVAECITDGEDGILLPNDGSCVAAACDVLHTLDADRARLARLAAGAMARAERLSWEQHMRPLLELLDRLVPPSP
ncbi:MAG: glycosyltransferase [Rhodovarius sp.]|nr:glycosyltransferase [Rhodovarius sp.]MDW8313357.1 glycosyltransferase [Rhodovarius sp.]